MEFHQQDAEPVVELGRSMPVRIKSASTTATHSCITLRACEFDRPEVSRLLESKQELPYYRVVEIEESDFLAQVIKTITRSWLLVWYIGVRVAVVRLALTCSHWRDGSSQIHSDELDEV